METWMPKGEWFLTAKECDSIKDSIWLRLSCPTLCDPMDYSLPDSSVNGILHTRILEWVAIPFSRRSSQPGGIKPGSPALQAYSLPSETPGKPIKFMGLLMFWNSREAGHGGAQIHHFQDRDWRLQERSWPHSPVWDLIPSSFSGGTSSSLTWEAGGAPGTGTFSASS